MITPHSLQSKMVELGGSPQGMVLVAQGADSNATLPAELRAHGLNVEEVAASKDLRFLSLKRESFDAIWSGESWPHYSIDDAQRILATYFQSLKPKTGLLFAVIAEKIEEDEAPHQIGHRYSEKAFGALVRQNGFQILLQARREGKLAYLLKRI